MEIDILNDILTLTVDNIIMDSYGETDYSRNQPFVSTRMSQGSRDGSRGSQQDRQSIGSLVSRGDSILSRDSRDTIDRRPDSRGGVSNLSTGSNSRVSGDVFDPLRTDFSLGSNAGSKKTQPVLKLRENCTSIEWLQYNAPLLLDDSLRKLNLDANNIEQRNLDHFDKEFLLEEKKRVKNELKRYDNEFDRNYKRFPRREEKEPMRPLYIYYKRLKQAISTAENPSQQNRPQRPPPQAQFQDVQPLLNRLESLKNQRANLREKLEDYQREFVRNHNRRIRYRQDIIDVEEDYNLYKRLKEDIKNLEENVKQLQRGQGLQQAAPYLVN